MSDLEREVELNRAALARETRDGVTELEEGVEMVGECRGRARRVEKGESANSDEVAVQRGVESVQILL